ncbi:serine/threonine-protein kinase [Variovorax fucosicus]|uniref:serine/threonine-protein kinase n=1 Tax=Variovorax fucosicus TaxID=3053517 RepID=UPI002578E8B0|nr:serine/threonine-protein kinase [Variovorax sp. J22G47]MDM0054681.1 serine/threonine-protein kinase [Variovorax sp. J22G47]
MTDAPDSAAAPEPEPEDRTQVVTRRPAAVAGASSEAGVLPPGSRLAEFEVTSLVGQGGFGAVYEAWDHTLERVVAIKEYLPVSLSTRQLDGTVVPLSERQRETFDLGMRSFINEARLLAQFDHPSLLKVYRFWQERGTTYMVMPFYRGDTLRQALAAIPGGVDEGWLLRIMDGVTQALAVMHGANCYHRDIAPDNIILLEGSGRPVVLDFGAARRVITDKTQAITVILKPGYAPIEQYAEMPDMSQGAWTDVYALAAVMHVAVSGRAPPPSVARLLSDSYAPLAHNEVLRQRYSLQLLSAIDAGLGVRPESRPQSMAELRAMLGLDGAQTVIPARTVHAASPIAGQAAARSAPSAAPPPPSPAPAPGKGKAIALAGVLGLAVLGGGGWWWSQQGGTPSDKQSVAVAPPPPIETPVVQAPPPPPPVPVARTPSESLQSLATSAAPGFDVTGTPRKAEVSIGKDKLAFEVRSKRDGFAYVYLLSSGGELFLLFPNLLDKYNKVTANSPISLPRASWPMDAGGPAGTNQFAVLVSEHERDFSGSGIQNDGVFPQFPLPVLAALEVARGNGPPPLLGKPVCAVGAPCNDVYGVGFFKITEK